MVLTLMVSAGGSGFWRFSGVFPVFVFNSGTLSRYRIWRATFVLASVGSCTV